MGRVIVGAAAGAVVMFILGFLFWGSPLGGLATGSLADAQAADVQAALAANISETGAYEVPVDGSQAQKAMYARGPIAFIQYTADGSGNPTPTDMIAGLIHMYISALLIGFALLQVSYHVREFSTRAAIVVFFATGAGVYMTLGAPIWAGHGWNYYIYSFVTDVIGLVAAGLIIARWFLPRDWDGGERVGAEAE
ncbi:MAG: hypothetical protein H7X93_00305 [Sphingomonadaceae bacterium]|nr:hypothetical protein [Sphingomonadaceae bacterium]